MICGGGISKRTSGLAQPAKPEVSDTLKTKVLEVDLETPAAFSPVSERVKFELPVASVVPVICPVAALIEMPGGSPTAE